MTSPVTCSVSLAAFPAHVAACQAPQFIVDDRHEAVESLPMARTPVFQKTSQLGAIGWIGHVDRDNYTQTPLTEAG